MRVVLAGASGLIGSALQRSLRADGHAVTSLVRSAPAGPEESRWAPDQHELDPSVLDGADAVVCLSGAGIGDRRWTPEYKRTLLRSRVDSVGTLAGAVALTGTPPVFLSASAVGFYGDTGERAVDERAPAGTGFLSDLCQQWEAATAPAESAGVRVALLRTGLVLTRTGGLVKRLVPIVKTGLAGRLGSGKQYLPWISLADEIAAIRFVLDHDVAGAVNLTGPQPVTNAEFMSTFGRLLHRPAVVPTPGFALRLALGEFASDTLTGQRAVPAKLRAAGFVHQHQNLTDALRWALAH